jgi:hypothetical protein
MHGCVDKSHTESLRGVISESARWHFRPEAKRIRAAEARHMREVLGPSKKRAKVVFLVPHMA